ncbi:MAG: translation initiation factor IF-2 [Dehalococcoidia bacterium]
MKHQSSGSKTRQTKKVPPKGAEVETVLSLPKSLTVKQLSDLLGISPIESIKRLMRKGVMASINQAIDYDTAADVAREFGYQPALEKEEEAPTATKEAPVSKREAKAQKPRPPVVIILGHVDHGKTSLLDAIRNTNVTAGEVGEITQHIGAYQVTVKDQEITFVDTPGHEAFTSMRARGASITDIAVLVIAADDGIMPQTIEAINHVKAAVVPIIVAINKIDKPNADIDRVKQQLTEHNLIIEEWGGDIIALPISAKTGEGLQELLEHIVLVSEMSELKANPRTVASGVVLESKLDSTRGTLATLLIQKGTLRVSDVIVVASSQWGKVKAMFDHEGKRIESAKPSTPVEIMGLSEVAQAGDHFQVVADERTARARVEEFLDTQRTQRVKSPTLDDVSTQIRSGETRGLNLILKADVQGSIDPIKSSLEQLESEDVKVRIIHSGSGGITESDIMLASASGAVIIGFNLRPDPRVKRLADAEGVEIRHYDIIYKLLEDIERTLNGMLEPTYIDVIDGHAEVRATFKVRTGVIAGCYIIDGKAARNCSARILRNDKVIYESQVSSLKHFKNDVSELAAGNECGIKVDGFSDYQVGDVIELYHREKQ